MTRRVGFAAVFTVPPVMIAIGAHTPAVEALLSSWISMRTRVRLELVLATPVCLWSA